MVRRPGQPSAVTFPGGVSGWGACAVIALDGAVDVTPFSPKSKDEKDLEDGKDRFDTLRWGED